MPDIGKHVGCTIADPRENKGTDGIFIPEIKDEIRANRLVDKYLHENPEASMRLGRGYNLGITYALDYLKNSPDSSPELRDTYTRLHSQRRAEIIKNHPGNQPIPDDSRSIYLDIMYACVLTNNLKAANKTDEFLNYAYNKTKFMTPEKFSEFFHKEQVRLRSKNSI